ncbi:hypothetical protein LVJ94_44795 [Pendulispora rubella]|uniref:Ferritin-like domain-containing protein n=1 Tax=Pendulispora rubella TaxID=2741070 RepID=A0ABZ2KZA0_9BACT
MRRPSGYSGNLVNAREVGEYFALRSELQEASVLAFRLLATDLESHRAPAALVRAAKRAGRDDERHAQMTASLARRHGASTAVPKLERPSPRPIEDVAIENAVEGCVRETFLALISSRQAETAKDDTIRAAMKTIARDESEHAALAWTLASWLEPRVVGDARARYGKAARTAIQDLRTEAYAPYPEPLRRVVGLPSVRDALALIDSLDRTMWQKLALSTNGVVTK